MIAGPPGSGKTRWLETVIAMKDVAVGGEPSNDLGMWRANTSTAHVVATWALTEAEAKRARLELREHTITWHLAAGLEERPERARRRLSRELSRFEVGDVRLEYFPANRQWGDPRASLPMHGPLVARLRQSKLATKYAGLPEVLVERAREYEGVLSEIVRARGVVFATAGADPLEEPYREAVALVSDDLRLEEARTLAQTPTLVFTRRSGARLTLDELTDGERQVTLFAMWSVWLGLRDGVVLVDAPELHVHRSRVTALRDRLLGLWPGCQVILATDAPELADRGFRIDLSA